MNGGWCSTGYRATYKSYDGNVYTGFVTCGHGNNYGHGVYKMARKDDNTVLIYEKIGEIVESDYDGRSSIDTAFVKITNPDYEMTNNVHYTSSAGDTRLDAVLNGTYKIPPIGVTLFKSGGATYLTSGEVRGTSGTGYFEINKYTTIYLYNLIVTDCIADHGDSGGVAYIMDGGVNAAAVGAVEGGSKEENLGYYISAYNISTRFGAKPY